jgi:uncharacterized SAM-binding protein YcdF (DUF218 family)
MYFFLSKTLYFLLSPFNWLLIIAAAWLLVKNKLWRRRLLIAAVVIVMIFGNSALQRAVILWWQPPVKQQTHTIRYQTGILLCGMTMSDRARQQTFFGGTADRFIQACRLYHTGTIQQILISGGDASLLQKGSREATFLRREMLAQGIPDSAILIESRSRNTRESAMQVKQIFHSLHLRQPAVLITSAMHMPRAQSLFAHAGIQTVAHCANFEVLENNFSFSRYFVPDLGTLGGWKYLLKELIGYKANQWLGRG